MMSPREINILVEDHIGTDGAYLKNFSYGIHDTFYHIYCGLDVDVVASRKRGLTLPA